MMRSFHFFVFILVFLTIYYLLNHFVITRLWSYAQLQRSPYTLVLTVFVVLLFPLTMYLSRTLPPSPALRILYILVTTLMGIVSISFAIVLITEITGRIFPSVRTHLQMAALVIITLCSVYALIQGRQLHVKNLTIPLKGLAQPLRVVQLSDIHMGMVITPDTARRITAEVNALNPDFTVISGDLFDGSRSPEKRCIEGFSALHAPVYFCSGNHDMYEGLDKVAAILKDSNIRYLKNESVVTQGVELIGIDNPSREIGGKNVIPADIRQHPDLPSILLFHPPSHLDEAVAAGIDLQLSGHTHYGQIWPFNYVVRAAFRHGFGLVRYKSLTLYTSPGTGTWGPPMRLGSRNTITLLNLVPA